MLLARHDPGQRVLYATHAPGFKATARARGSGYAPDAPDSRCRERNWRTKSVAGASRISRGDPIWWQTPSFITAMRSASSIASSWSCVT